MSDIKELKDEELEILNGGRKDREKREAYKKKVSSWTEKCPQCGEERLKRNHVCPNCGYRGK